MPLEKKKKTKPKVSISKKKKKQVKSKDGINISINIGDSSKPKQSIPLAKDKLLLGDKSIPINERRTNIIQPSIRRIGGSYSNITPNQYLNPPSQLQQKFEFDKQLDIKSNELKVDILNNIKNFYEELGNPLSKTEINKLGKLKKQDLIETREKLLTEPDINIKQIITQEPIVKSKVELIEKELKELPLSPEEFEKKRGRPKKIDTKKEQVEPVIKITPEVTPIINQPSYFMKPIIKDIPFLQVEKIYQPEILKMKTYEPKVEEINLDEQDEDILPTLDNTTNYDDDYNNFYIFYDDMKDYLNLDEQDKINIDFVISRIKQKLEELNNDIIKEKQDLKQTKNIKNKTQLIKNIEYYNEMIFKFKDLLFFIEKLLD